MSLHALAGHMAAKGRGSDSMLVHMTPEEVQSLQVLALRAGGTLTINPETGLPEANFLKKMLPMIAGFALGPAGFGLMSAGMAGATVGGITALSTGSLSRGLMAGLGAYGGASLGAGLADAGTGAIAAGDIAAQQAAGTFPTLAEGATKEAIAKYATDVGALRDAALSKAGEAGLGAKMTAGLGQMASNPGMYAKDLLKSTYAAATPILAGDMVPTTTKLPDSAQTPSYIRPFLVDQYSQQMQALTPIDASKVRMRRERDFAGGGIVALAGGGVSDEAVANWFATNPGASDTAIASAMREFSVSPEQVARVTGVGQPEVQQRYEAAIAPQIVSRYSEGVAGPGATTAQMGSGYLGIYDELLKEGISPTELFNAPGYQGWSQSAIQRAYDVAGAINVFDPRTDSATLSDKDWAAFMDRNKFTTRDIAQATGLSEAEVQRRYDAAKATSKVVNPISTTVTTDLPGGGVGTTDTYTGGVSTTPATYAPPGTTNPYGNYMNPGDITRNADGTITVQPNIPGRPFGGFTGMGQVRDAYTAGGGSLGYTPYAPKTIQEFENRFTTSGGSKQAYDFLMNKGAADIRRPVTRTGELMLPYAEAMGLRRPGRVVMPRKPVVVDKKEEPAPQDSTVGGANGGVMRMALGGLGALAAGGSASQYNLGSYSDGGRLLRGPGDGVSDSIPATIGDKQPARLADGEFVVPARIVSELGNGSTEAGARKLYAMMDRVQKARGKTTGKNRVAANTRADKYLPA